MNETRHELTEAIQSAMNVNHC